jgi:hypothetical protein
MVTLPSGQVVVGPDSTFVILIHTSYIISTAGHDGHAKKLKAIKGVARKFDIVYGPCRSAVVGESGRWSNSFKIDFRDVTAGEVESAFGAFGYKDSYSHETIGPWLGRMCEFLYGAKCPNQ